MKLLCLLLIATFFKTHAGGFAQTVDLSVDRVSLETVFKEIKKQTGYRFIYMKEQLRSAKPVSIHVQKAGLKQVLDLCFFQQPFRYIIEDRYIIVQPLKEDKIETDNKQLIDIKGKTVDERGDVVSGVTVKVKGTTTATASDQEGMFQFKGIDEGAVLLFSGTNVEDYSFRITDSRDLTIRLKTKIGKLDEVQVIAYGSTTQRMNTGNVSKISSSVIERQPVANPVAAIQGRAAGVFVITQNGLPGGNITVQIRGRGSINSGTEPLFVIDGIPFQNVPLNNSFGTLTTGITGSISPLNSINPSDIESIEILKDADATALYGSRAANGVVLITTKKGRAGKIKADITVYSGESRASVIPELLNQQEYLQIRREGFANDQLQPTALNAPDLLLWDTTSGRNWANYLLGGKAKVINARISLSGGTEQIRFLLSGFYRKEGSILPGDANYSKGGSHISIQYTSTDKKFGIDYSSSYSTDINHTLSSSVFSILYLPPNLPVYDAGGEFNWTGITDVNPEAALLRKAKNTSNSLIANLALRYRLFEGAELKTTFGYNYTGMDQVMTFPKKSIHPLTGGESYAYYGKNKTILFIAEPQLEYSKKINKNSVRFFAGATVQTTTREGVFITGKNYSNEGLLEYAGAAGTVSASNQYSQYKYASLFGRMKYDYAERYLLQLQARRDGSSRFGPGRRTGNFWSAGAAWIFSKEKFLKEQHIISYGKLRASYGTTGNDQIPDYQFLSTYRASSTLYQGVTSLSPARIANALFGWESNRKAEAALEAGFFSNRALLTTSFYHHRSSNQLVEYPLPYMSGPFGYYLENLPAVIDNSGWEFEIDLNPVRKKNINWTVQMNLTIPKNKLVSYPGLASSSYVHTYVIGKDVSIRKGLHFTGVDMQTGIPLYEDVNKDSQISLPEDYTVMGKTSPAFYGGAGTELSYGSFELSLFFQFTSQCAAGNSSTAGSMNNQYRDVLGRWKQAGDETSIPKASVNQPVSYSYLSLSDAVFFKASYLRFKNISLSYRLPENLLRLLHLQQVRVYAEGQNIYTWYKRSNLPDPETGYNGITPLRTITAGFQITL